MVLSFIEDLEVIKEILRSTPVEIIPISHFSFPLVKIL
jgi:hypothetical protein